MQGQSIKIAPKTVKNVTQEELEKKLDLQTAKYRRLLCVLLTLFILMLICFSISLSNALNSAKTEKRGFGFSCIFRLQVATTGVIKNYMKEDDKNMLDSFDSQKGIFTAKMNGIYHVDYRFSKNQNSNAAKNANVSLVRHKSQESWGGNSGRSLYFELKTGEKLSLKSERNTGEIRDLYFCVAFTP